MEAELLQCRYHGWERNVPLRESEVDGNFFLMSCLQMKISCITYTCENVRWHSFAYCFSRPRIKVSVPERPTAVVFMSPWQSEKPPRRGLAEQHKRKQEKGRLTAQRPGLKSSPSLEAVCGSLARVVCLSALTDMQQDLTHSSLELKLDQRNASELIWDGISHSGMPLFHLGSLGGAASPPPPRLATQIGREQELCLHHPPPRFASLL